MNGYGVGDIIGMAIVGLLFGVLIGYVICLYRYRKRVSDEIQEVFNNIEYIRGYSQATIDRRNEAPEGIKELRLKQDSINSCWLNGYKIGWINYELLNEDIKEPKDMFKDFERTYRIRDELLQSSLFFM